MSFCLSYYQKKTLEFILKLGSIQFLVSFEELNYVFCLYGAIVKEEGAFLDVREAMMFAFDVPAMKELRDVSIIKEGSSRLSEARTYEYRWSIVGLAAIFFGRRSRHCEYLRVQLRS